MTRYWFKTRKGYGVGVTAHSLEDAQDLVREHATYWSESGIIDIIADIDVRTLDQNHVIPNMGPSAVRGVWYPFLNL
jgi:hypothetical protein